jgi:ureidoglycolate hydrolase
MNLIPPSGRPTPLRRWFLALLTTRPARRLLHHTLLATLTLQLVAPSWAGEEFHVNTYTTGWQGNPAVALDNDGDFVVAWQSNGSYGYYSDITTILGQRYNSIGVAQGSEFQINTYTTGHKGWPAVAIDNNGDFVVVWDGDAGSGNDTGSSIQGQRYNSAGIPQGIQFQINTYTTNLQFDPAVAMDSDGDFVVVWTSFGSDNDAAPNSVQGQRYNSAGVPQGNQFQVNSYTTGSQHDPAVALDSDGDFVVVWQSKGSPGNDNDDHSVQAQRYNSSGVAQSSQFQVNTYTTNDQRYLAIALDSDGDFVVIWESEGSTGGDTDGWSIQGQRYNSAGIPQSSQFQVNNYTTNDQRYPSVALDSDGDFVIVWWSGGSAGSDTDQTSIHARRYDSAGLPQDNQFQVNTYTFYLQLYPDISLDSDGDFVIAWQTHAWPTDGTAGIAARLFSLQPTDVSVVKLQPAAPTPLLPRFTLFALLSTLFALLTALYRRRRPISNLQSKI